MRILWSLFVFFAVSVFAVDYDCVVVGSSPFSLFEALYQYYNGKSVLIVEEDEVCGGAWKSIDVCGVRHVDLGCHLVNGDQNLRKFFEEYAGCKVVPMDDPFETGTVKGHNGYYFSRGCYELVHNLMELIGRTNVALWVNQRVEDVSFTPAEDTATLTVNGKEITASKVVITPMSHFSVNHSTLNSHKSQFYHLYLLVQDPTPPSFSYHSGISSGVSRMMNLTHFVGLSNTGRQMIVFQVHSENDFRKGEQYIEDLKNKGMLGESAYILERDSYIYAQSRGHSSFKNSPLFETLHTSVLSSLGSYIVKWKQVLKPY